MNEVQGLRAKKLGHPVIWLGNDVAIHLSPYTPYIHLWTDDAEVLDSVGIKLKDLQPINFIVMYYNEQVDWDRFSQSTVYHYLRGVAEGHRWRMYICCQEIEGRRRLHHKSVEIRCINFTDDTYRAQVVRLTEMPKFQPLHIKYPRK